MKETPDDQPIGGILAIPLNFQGRDLDEQVGPIVHALVDVLPPPHRLHLASRLLVLTCEIDPDDEAAVHDLATRTLPVSRELYAWLDRYQRQEAEQSQDGRIDVRPIYAALGEFVAALLELARQAPEVDIFDEMRRLMEAAQAKQGWAPEMQA